MTQRMPGGMYHAQHMFACHEFLSIFEKPIHMIGVQMLSKKASAPGFRVVVVDKLSLPAMGGDLDLKVGLEVAIASDVVAVVVRIDEQPELFGSNGTPL